MRPFREAFWDLVGLDTSVSSTPKFTPLSKQSLMMSTLSEAKNVSVERELSNGCTAASCTVAERQGDVGRSYPGNEIHLHSFRHSKFYTLFFFYTFTFRLSLLTGAHTTKVQKKRATSNTFSVHSSKFNTPQEGGLYTHNSVLAC